MNIGLCQGRHEIPNVENYIFPTEIDPLAVTKLQEDAKRKLTELNCKTVNLYVTGLTVALVAVLNAAKQLDITVKLWHYNRDEGNYYSQEVL